MMSHWYYQSTRRCISCHISLFSCFPLLSQNIIYFSNWCTKPLVNSLTNISCWSFHWIVTWEKKLSPILLDLYQKNTDLEVGDHKITRTGFFKSISSSIKKIVTFDLPPIEEENHWLSQVSIEKISTSKLCSHLIDPRHPEK